MSSVCGADLDANGRAFLSLLTENQRLDYCLRSPQQFDALVADDQNVADVEVVSAVTLDEPQQQRLAAALQKRLQRQVRLQLVDRRLIGGAIVRSGDLLIDGSLKGKLERLETELTV